MTKRSNDNIISIRLNDINKIKYEELHEFTESVFYEAYTEAFRMAGLLIDANQELRDCGQSEAKRRNHNQIYNVISFLGERGMGKTSAMLSFVAVLENDFCGRATSADTKETIAQLTGVRGLGKNAVCPIFSVLDYIDATMLEKKEGVLDVILAKMWDKFELASHDFAKVRTHEHLVAELREKFQLVRECYLIQKKISRDSLDDDKEISTLSTLHKLSGSMNLRDEFQKLVDSYLEFMRARVDRENVENYLVISIDDIDMGAGNAYELLEQIRRFLSIPKVIIFLTADIKRLKRICNQCEDALYHRQNQEDKGKNLERERFVNDYLGKLLPHNNRIYMPDFKEFGGELQPEYHIEFKVKDCIHHYNEKDTIILAHKEYLNMLFDGSRNRRHFLQHDSLRSLVNYFNDMTETIESCSNETDPDKKRHIRQLLQWFKNDLRYRLAEKITQEEQRLFFDDLFKVDVQEIGERICWYIQETLETVNSDYASGYQVFLDNTAPGYGAALHGCTLLRQHSPEHKGFCSCIIAFYTWLLACMQEQVYAGNGLAINDRTFGKWIYPERNMSPVLFHTLSPEAYWNRINIMKHRLEFEMEQDLWYALDWNPNNGTVALTAPQFKEKIKKLITDNLDAICCFQLLMYAFQSTEYRQLEEIPIDCKLDLQGTGTVQLKAGSGGIRIEPLADLKNEEGTFKIRIYPYDSKCDFNVMNFASNSLHNQFTDAKGWLENIIKAIMEQIESQVFLRIKKRQEINNGEGITKEVFDKIKQTYQDYFTVDDIDLLSESEKLPSKEYERWLDKYQSQEVLPYFSPDIMYNLERVLSRKLPDEINFNMLLGVTKQTYSLIASELKQRDEYFNQFDQTRNLLFAERFTECPYVKRFFKNEDNTLWEQQYVMLFDGISDSDEDVESMY